MSNDFQKLLKILGFAYGKWRINSDKVPAGDDKPLAIITCIGDFGVGKSFLSNVLLNYLLLKVCLLFPSCVSLPLCRSNDDARVFLMCL